MRLRAFGIKEFVRLIGALVDGRTAEFCKPDRFGLWHPIGRSLGPHPPNPVVMRQRPPAADVLVAVDPRLIIGTIRDWRADLRRLGLGGMVVPVIALAALDIGLEVVEIIDRGPLLRVEVILVLAPVAERHVIVDADEIDLRIGPQRIEVKQMVPLRRLIAEILRPIRRIAQFDLRPQERAHLSHQILEPLHKGKAARPPDLRQPAQFRADTERLDAARRRTKRCVMQDKAAKAPLIGAVIAHLPARDGEIAGLSGAEKARDLRIRERSAIRAACQTRRGRQRDPPPPRQHRLALGVAVGIG